MGVNHEECNPFIDTEPDSWGKAYGMRFSGGIQSVMRYDESCCPENNIAEGGESEYDEEY